MTEEQWWERVKESPNDPLVILAFADWLEEQGDPRAEGLRYVSSLGRKPYDCDYSVYWSGEKFAPARRAACWGRVGFNSSPDWLYSYSTNLIPDELWAYVEKETPRPPPGGGYPWKHFFVEGLGEGPLVEKGLRVLLNAWTRREEER